MADEDKSSRTELPTDKRIEEARSRGQFPQAPEIVIVLILMSCLAFFVFGVSYYTREVRSIATYFFDHLAVIDLTPNTVTYGWINFCVFFIKVLGPLFGLCIIAVLAGGGFQSGFSLTPKVLEWNFDRLNPVNGFKRIFSLSSLVQFGIDLIKFAAVSLTLYSFTKDCMQDPIFNFPISAFYVGEFMYKVGSGILIRLVLVMIVIASINYLYQRWKTSQDLMMTKQEVKEERKSQEIDPQIKSAQRQMARRLIRRQMLAAVPTADVIVTNPTHYAVALKYEQGKDAAPLVVAKGENMFARRIIEVANQYGVPRVENKPVARLLYRVGEIGKSIPLDLYQVVAEILAYVYQKHKYYFHRLKARRRLLK